MSQIPTGASQAQQNPATSAVREMKIDAYNWECKSSQTRVRDIIIYYCLLGWKCLTTCRQHHSYKARHLRRRDKGWHLHFNLIPLRHGLLFLSSGL